MESVIFIIFLVASGLYDKRVNTLHFRKLALALKEKRHV